MREAAAALLLLLTCGCGAPYKMVTTSAQLEAGAAVVYADAGETVKEAVDALPVAGGTVILGPGTWRSGYEGTLISRPNISIQGSGMPSYNSSFTALSGGTIILGSLVASTGADYFSVRDLGIDAGQNYINSQGGVPTDALVIFNNGRIVGAPPVQSPTIENVACLGYSPTAPFHCMLVTNVNNAYIHNVQTVMNCHGLVLKGTNSRIDGVYSRGHATDSVIVKGENFAPVSQDTLSNINIEPLFSPGDTQGMVIQGTGSPVSNVDISDVQIRSPMSFGIYVQGETPGTYVSAVKFSNVLVDHRGPGPVTEYCVALSQYVSDVSFDRLNCTNMWSGIVPLIAEPASFSNFTITNSQFNKIWSNAVQTFGTWSIGNSRFAFVAGDAIVNSFGVTTLHGDTFIVVSGSELFSGGGSFVNQ